MKIKIDEIECKFCNGEFSHESSGWDFWVDVTYSGCDCCSDSHDMKVDVKCPHCEKSFELGID